MQRSYLVKSPVHFADFGFFVKVGDILVHDTSNANRLTVYRNGEVVKAVKQTTLGLAAMQKNGFIEEVAASSRTAPKAPQKPVEPPKAAPKHSEPKPAPKAAPEEQTQKLGEALRNAERQKPKPEPRPEPKPKKEEKDDEKVGVDPEARPAAE